MAFREVVLDIETTGLSAREGHRIIEIGCVAIIDGEISNSEIFQVYINPERSMPMEAFKIHGISEEFLKDKPIFSAIHRDFLNFIGSSNVIAHNAQFDIGFLNHELWSLGAEAIEQGRVTDTLLLARKKFPGAPANLDALCQRFNISLAKRLKHGALLDAMLLAQVYLCLRQKKQADLFAVSSASNLETIEQMVSAQQHQILPPRSFPVSEEELNNHNKMLDSISNAVWRRKKAT